MILFVHTLNQVKRWESLVLQNKIHHSIVFTICTINHSSVYCGIQSWGHLLDYCNQCHSEHVRHPQCVYFILNCILQELWPYPAGHVQKIPNQFYATGNVTFQLLWFVSWYNGSGKDPCSEHAQEENTFSMRECHCAMQCFLEKLPAWTAKFKAGSMQA